MARVELSELTEEQYRILTLRYDLDASWLEIAHAVGATSEDAVRKKASRAILQLGARLRSRSASR